MTKFPSAMFLALFSTALFAAPPSYKNVYQDLYKVKNTETRSALSKFVDDCTHASLADCKLSEFDLTGYGLEYIDDGEGSGFWAFRDPQSNRVYNDILSMFASGADRGNFDLYVTAPEQQGQAPSMSLAGHDFNRKDASDFWLIVQQHINSEHITFDATRPMSTPRAEWLRLITWAFIITRDIENANHAQALLRQEIANHPQDMDLFNNTIQVGQQYLNAFGKDR